MDAGCRKRVSVGRIQREAPVDGEGTSVGLVQPGAPPHQERCGATPIENEEQLLKSRVRKNLAIGLVITVVIAAVSVVLADDGSEAEELRMSLAVGLLVTGAVTGGTWLLQRKRSGP
jgi:hypothetical protein